MRPSDAPQLRPHDRRHLRTSLRNVYRHLGNVSYGIQDWAWEEEDDRFGRMHQLQKIEAAMLDLRDWADRTARDLVVLIEAEADEWRAEQDKVVDLDSRRAA